MEESALHSKLYARGGAKKLDMSSTITILQE